jgi:hypothetical protein
MQVLSALRNEARSALKLAYVVAGTRNRLERPNSRERVSHVEQRDFPEITVIGIERTDAVLEQNGCDVGVRDEVPPNGQLARHILAGVRETVQLGRMAVR